jgi:hypothetical protein
MAVTDSEQLHFKRMIADVRVQPPSGQYGESNVIKGYAPVNGAPVLAAVRNQRTAATPPPQSNPGKPWARNRAPAPPADLDDEIPF